MAKARKVAFHTLGCKVNQYETEAMAKMFRERGYEVVDERDFADVYVVNTCTVTAVADKKSRQYVRRMKKVNPNSVMVVTGCYSQISPDDVKAIKGVDIITGMNEKQNIPDYVEKQFEMYAREGSNSELPENNVGNLDSSNGPDAYIHDRNHLKDFVEMGPATSTENRTRAYIKVQEGCNRFCSYCVIPYARGPVRSRPLDNIIEEAKALLDAGYKELVLTGINTAQYDMEGRDLYRKDSLDNQNSFHGQVELSCQEGHDGTTEVFGIEKVIAALNDLPGDFRIRLSSLEPAVVNSDYVKRLFKYDKLCHHLHMSAQSGSDSVLKEMNRPYNLDGYYDLVNTLFDFDDCYGISTDIIVGFPGEKDKDFEDSCRLVSECCFCKTHIFKYSKRPLTKAAEMKNQVAPQIKSRRSDELEEVAKAATTGFFEINMAAASEGRTERVLLEETVKFPDGQEYYTGFTGNYIRVYIPADRGQKPELNEFVEVRLKDIFRDGMIAELV